MDRVKSFGERASAHRPLCGKCELLKRRKGFVFHLNGRPKGHINLHKPTCMRTRCVFTVGAHTHTLTHLRRPRKGLKSIFLPPGIHNSLLITLCERGLTGAPITRAAEHAAIAHAIAHTDTHVHAHMRSWSAALSDRDRKRTERLNSAESFLSVRLVLNIPGSLHTPY